MAIVTIGIDLAKNCFAVHGVGPSGKPEFLRPEGDASALALLAGVSGAGAVALTVATIKKKMECVQRFLQRLYGFTEYLHSGTPV